MGLMLWGIRFEVENEMEKIRMMLRSYGLLLYGTAKRMLIYERGSRGTVGASEACQEHAMWNRVTLFHPIGTYS
jgi:hypothetical protein